MPLRDGTGPTGQGPGTGLGIGGCVPGTPATPLPAAMKKIAYKGTIQGQKVRPSTTRKRGGDSNVRRTASSRRS